MKIRADWSRLTEKQRGTIKGFMKTGNKLGSFRKMYHPDKETLTRSQMANCYKLFNKPHIKVIVDQITAEAVRIAGIEFDEIMDGSVDELIEQQKDVATASIDAFWVLKRASLLADFNIKKFLKVDGNGNAVYDFSDATDEDWYCVQEYTIEELPRGKGDDVYAVDKLKIKTFDKLRALELVGKHIEVGAFKDENPLNVRIIRDEDADL